MHSAGGDGVVVVKGSWAVLMHSAGELGCCVFKTFAIANIERITLRNGIPFLPGSMYLCFICLFSAMAT